VLEPIVESGMQHWALSLIETGRFSGAEMA
jgi:hypothetical protein